MDPADGQELPRQERQPRGCGDPWQHDKDSVDGRHQRTNGCTSAVPKLEDEHPGKDQDQHRRGSSSHGEERERQDGEEVGARPGSPADQGCEIGGGHASIVDGDRDISVSRW